MFRKTWIGLTRWLRKKGRASDRMFRKTLIRLTAINSTMLILLIALLGGTIYFYEQHQLFSRSDAVLKNAAFGQRMEPSPRQRRLPLDPRLIVALVDADGNLMESNREDLLGDSEAMKPFLTKSTDKIVDKKIDDFDYRVLANEVDTNVGKVTVYYIINVNQDRALLNTLLTIILAGTGIGAVLSVFLGYLLARRALRPIQAAWEKQNRFVADASHELRTPLSIIQLKTESLLTQPDRTIQEKGEVIGTVLDETRRLTKLVGNLLTLARSDANRLEVQLLPMDVKPVLQKVTTPFAEMAVYDGKKFELNMDPEPLMIDGDSQRIHQLLVILLDNAMKFTHAGGTIRVTCSRENRMAQITVADSGIGISETDLPRIFDRFYQADKARTDKRGTGLGLSIADWIVRRHNGKITVSSRPGKGTMFTVRLPLRKFA